MSTDPDQIRTEIERTRDELSSNVDALAEKVSPSSIAHRQAEKVRSAAGSVRERVMGSHSPGGLPDYSNGVRDAASTVGDKATDATAAVRRETEGNPIAVGLIAFGAGWLASALLPASSREQDLARTVKEKVAPLAQDLGEAAKQAAQNLKEPATDALESVKATATGAVETVKQEGTQATEEVTQGAAEAGRRVGSQ